AERKLQQIAKEAKDQKVRDKADQALKNPEAVAKADQKTPKESTENTTGGRTGDARKTHVGLPRKAQTAATSIRPVTRTRPTRPPVRESPSTRPAIPIRRAQAATAAAKTPATRPLDRTLPPAIRVRIREAAAREQPIAPTLPDLLVAMNQAANRLIPRTRSGP